MADEQKQPEEEIQPEDAVSREELEEIAASVPPPDEYPKGQADELEEALEEAADGEPDILEKGVAAAYRATEEAEEAAPVQAFDSAVSGIQAAIESIPGAPEHPQEALADAHLHDTTVLFGRTLNFPIYTVVFFALGALTIIEVLLAEILSGVEVIKIPVLLSIATIKAALVVIFYMHLNTDSRVFAVTFIVPVVIALLSVLFLLGIPTGY